MERHQAPTPTRTPRPRWTATAAAALALLALAAPAAAGDRAWTPLGPDGGAIYALAVDPADGDVVYAASSNTVFRSTDGGDSWSFAGVGLAGSLPGFRALAVSGGAVLAGSSWEGIWRSLDDGRTWRPTADGLPSRAHVEALVVDPHQPGRLWAATWEGLFVSADQGASWTSRQGDLPLRGGVRSLAIDPATGQLYAMTVDELFTSTNDGASWSLLRCLGRRCSGAVVDPQHAATVFSTSGGLLRSRDAGATWQKLRGPKGNWSFTPLAFHGSRLFAVGRFNVQSRTIDRIYFSDDQGDHWALAAQQPESSITVLAAAGDSLWLGSTGDASLGGVFRSRDGGNHWEAARAGLSARWIETLAVDPLQPGRLYAHASDNLFASVDDGQSWRLSLPAPGVHVFGAGDLLADPVVAGRVWSTTGGNLYRSDDGGVRWTSVRRVGFGVTALEADLRTAGGLWVGTSNALFQSPNGRGWKRIRISRAENVGVVDVAADPADPRVVWVAGYGFTPGGGGLGARLYRSSDGGQSWQRRDDGLPSTSGWGVSRVVLDRERADTLFAVAGDGIFRSRDAGTSWQRLPAPAAVAADPEAIRWDLVAAPAAPTTLYATLESPEGEGVYRSRDGGDSWQRLGANTGEAGAGSVRALVVDPHDPRRVLIGTGKRGIFTYTDVAP